MLGGRGPFWVLILLVVFLVVGGGGVCLAGFCVVVFGCFFLII